MITLGWSDFAKKYSKQGTGNSFSTLDEQTIIRLTLENWHKAIPGNGETDLNRKILVPLPIDGFFCPPKAKLVLGMPINAEIVERQKGEEPYIQIYVDRSVAESFNALIEKPAKSVFIVCYNKEALLENNGTRSTDCDWEIVTILCNDTSENQPMDSLTMARNMLEKTGGTKGEYSAKEFAEAVWLEHTKKELKVKN
jgi:hypothetical protein